MSLKTIFVISISVVLTIVLMNNTEDIDFWLFGVTQIPKLAVLGIMFALGFIVGMLAMRSTKQAASTKYESANGEETSATKKSSLSEEDQEYLH